MPFRSAPRCRAGLPTALVRALALSLLAAASGCFHRAPKPEPPAPSLYMLGAGSRIRVTTTSLGATPYIGHFIAVRGDTLSMRADRTLDSLAFPLTGIQRLEVSTWHGSRVMLGAQVGGVAGFAAGGLAAALCKSGSNKCSSGRRSALALGGGAIGAGVGALVGQRLSRERWATVQLSPTIRTRAPATR